MLLGLVVVGGFKVSIPVTKIPVPPRHDGGDAACTPEEIYCYTQYNSLSAIPRPLHGPPDAMAVHQIQVICIIHLINIFLIKKKYFFSKFFFFLELVEN